MIDLKYSNGVQNLILRFHGIPNSKIKEVKEAVDSRAEKGTFECLGDAGRWVAINCGLPSSRFNWVLTDA